jgi:hypothetical protein
MNDKVAIQAERPKCCPQSNVPDLTCCECSIYEHCPVFFGSFPRDLQCDTKTPISLHFVS